MDLCKISAVASGTWLRFDGARFYQLRPNEYSLFTIKIYTENSFDP